MQTVSPVKVVTAREAVEESLPPRIQEALGQLVGAAKEGLLALSVSVGLGVLSEMMAWEVDEVCGPKHKHNPDRTAYRHGTDDGTVTLGGRRLEIERPRMRAKDGSGEVPVRTYEHFADRDPLQRVVMERMLAGVSTRRYRRTQEPVGEQIEVKARSTSKSSISRTFKERTKRALGALMSRSLADVRLAAMMIDGLIAVMRHRALRLRGQVDAACQPPQPGSPWDHPVPSRERAPRASRMRHRGAVRRWRSLGRARRSSRACLRA